MEIANGMAMQLMDCDARVECLSVYPLRSLRGFGEIMKIWLEIRRDPEGCAWRCHEITKRRHAMTLGSQELTPRCTCDTSNVVVPAQKSKSCLPMTDQLPMK